MITNNNNGNDNDNDKNKNLWKLQSKFTDEYDEYMDKLCESNDGIITNNNDDNNQNETPYSLAPTPANSLFSTSSSSSMLNMEINMKHQNEDEEVKRQNQIEE